MPLENKAESDKSLEKVLGLSRRISAFSPPMKPFLRFSQHGKQDKQRAFHPRLFWDFDDLLQKKLLTLAYEIASPEDIVHACIDQWKQNLEGVCTRIRESRERIIRDGIEYTFDLDERCNFIVERMKPGERFLYIGCGAGRQCLLLTKGRLQVIGIDTMAPMLDLAQGWAAYWNMHTSFICMDILKHGFKPHSFDGFLLEFYGSWPSPNQTLALQRELDSLLKPSGLGFIVAARKKYNSYWFLSGSHYPIPVAKWLVPQAAADFFFSQADSCEERLLTGLYNRSHTVESLSCELAHTFTVEECLYERDPRYVIAVVRSKEKHDETPTTAKWMHSRTTHQESHSMSTSEINASVEKIEYLTDQLESHAEKVCSFFATKGDVPTSRFFHSLSSDIAEFADSLGNTLDPSDENEYKGES